MSRYPFGMRFAAISGLFFLPIVGLMALPEIIDLQATGEGLTGDISVFFGRITFLIMVLFGAIAFGTVAVAAAVLLKLR